MNIKEGITKNIILLGLVSLLNDISSEMLYPIIPIFLSSVLNAPMSVIGLIEGISEATSSILRIYFGHLSDKLQKRKPFIVIGYSLSSIAKPMLAFAYSWYFVLFSRFLDRFGKGIRTASRDALIASSTESKYRGKAFGFHKSMDTLGAAIGPLLSLALLNLLGENENSYRNLFILSFIPTLISIFLIVFFIKDYKKEELHNISKSDKKLSKEFKIFTALYMIFAIGNFSDAFLILKSQSLGASLSMVIFIYFLYNITYAILSTPFGHVADKIGKFKALFYGMIIFSIVYFSFAFNTKKEFLWFLFILYGFYSALNEGIYKAIISDLSNENNRAFAMGTFQAFNGICLLLSSLIAGFLWEKVSPTFPFLLSSITAILSGISILIWRKSYKV